VKEWTDISVPIRTGMITYPGDKGVHIDRELDRAKGDPVTVSFISMSAHAGTHVDAPLHFIDRGKTIDQISPGALQGRARVIAIEDHQSIKVEELEVNKIKAGEILLFKTDNSALWRRESFSPDYVYLSAPAARYLAEQKVRTVGIDYLSVDKVDGIGEAHRTLLEGSIVIVESLDLSAVLPGIYEFMCLPLRIEGAEAAPARVMIRTAI
jgi:arylformamidase